MKTFHSYNKKNKIYAQTLRKTMTEAEIILWSKIRGGQIYNVQFYRQKSIANYIVDFYASCVKLVVEIDGGQHFEEEHIKRDLKRDIYLKSLGITVLRFNNLQVRKELNAVLEVIFREIQRVINPPSRSATAALITPFKEKGEI